MLKMRYWEQKACIKRILGGDADTKYFHNLVRDRRQRQSITSIYTSTGELCTSEKAIQSESVSYYSQLFCAEPVSGVDALLHYIPTLVSPDMNNQLLAVPTLEDTKAAVWDLDPHSAAGPDEYNGYFFHHC